MIDIENTKVVANWVRKLNFYACPRAAEVIDELVAEVERLQQRLLTAAGDDLCRLTQEEIKAMSAGGVPIPPKEEFLASCERFHAQVASTSGVNQNCLTLAQLIAEVERLQSIHVSHEEYARPLADEMNRLRPMVREAYLQGYADGPNDRDGEQAWEESEIKRRMEDDE